MLRRVPLRKVRIALGVALALNVAFAAANLWLAPPRLTELLVYKLIQVAVLLGCLVLLRRRGWDGVTQRAGELGLVVIIAMATLSEIATGGRDTVPILAVAVALGAGAFIPLGRWGQVRLAVIAALAVLANDWLLGHQWDNYPTIVALLGIAGSILVAQEMSRHQRLVGSLVDTSLSSLRQSEARFDHLAAATSTVFWWLGPSLDVRYVSPAFERVWGSPPAVACRSLRTVFESIHPDDRERMVDALHQIGQQGMDEEFRIVRPDGSVRRVHTRASVIVATDGGTPVIAGVSEDVTERRLIEDELRNSQKRYADLVDNAPDAILTFDGRGRLLTANPAAERLLGRSVDDLKACPVFGGGVIAPRSRVTVVGIARALAANRAVPPQELVLLRGGRHVAVESNQRIVRGAGASLEVEVILRDLTERRRAEEAARLRAFAAHLESLREDERGRLARSLHDDFAQSLAALGLQIGWLTRALPTDLAEPNAKVRAMAEQLSSMMRTVRKMTRELRPPVLDDFGLATAVHWEAHEFHERTGIDCVMHIERDEAQDTDARAVAVFRTVQEALANVAARGATSVRVELDAGDSMIAVRIEDDGPAPPSAALSWDLVCMRERAHLLGGSFEIEMPPAGGMSFHLRVPRGAHPA